MKEANQALFHQKAGAIISAFFRFLKNFFKLFVLGVAIFAGLLACLLALLTWVWLTPYSGMSFNSEKWIELAETSRGGECARGLMGKDIVDNVLKTGMSRQEVENIFGPSDATYYPDKHLNEYIYNLGMCSGLAWDFDFLHVTYDGENRLIRAVNLQH